jgi:hypothetical protein
MFKKKKKDVCLVVQIMILICERVNLAAYNQASEAIHPFC